MVTGHPTPEKKAPIRHKAPLLPHVDRLGSGPRLAGRIWSGVPVTASLKKPQSYPTAEKLAVYDWVCREGLTSFQVLWLGVHIFMGIFQFKTTRNLGSALVRGPLPPKWQMSSEP